MTKTPSTQLINAVERSDNVLAEAATEDFDRVFAALSGGNDSSVALEVAYQSPEIELDGVFFMDTGVNVTQTKNFVRKEAQKRGLSFHSAGEEYALKQERFENLVKTYGFPGQPIHKQMFRNLKDKRAQRYLKQFTENGEKIALISGVYSDESTQRNEKIGDDPIEETTHATWISPVYDWLEETVDEYRKVFDLRENDVTALLHTSGDCNCGAYGSREELRDLMQFYPESAKQIKQLERKAAKLASHGQIPVEYSLWCHGQTKDREIEAKINQDQEKLAPPDEGVYACSGCERRTTKYQIAGQAETQWEAYLRSDTHSLTATIAVYCVECDIVVHDGREHRETHHQDAGAKPTDADMRAVPCRCGDMGNTRITQGERSTKNPNGGICDAQHNYHNWEPYDSKNGIAKRKCSKCGAYEVPHYYEGQDPTEDVFPMSAAETPAKMYRSDDQMLESEKPEFIEPEDNQSTLSTAAD